MKPTLIFLATILLPVLAVGQDRITWDNHGKFTVHRVNYDTCMLVTKYDKGKYKYYNRKKVKQRGTYIDTTAQTIYRGTSKVTIFYDAHLVTSYVIKTQTK
jgi:hypothetical protein